MSEELQTELEFVDNKKRQSINLATNALNTTIGTLPDFESFMKASELLADVYTHTGPAEARGKKMTVEEYDDAKEALKLCHEHVQEAMRMNQKPQARGFSPGR